MATYNKFEGFVGYLGLAAVNLNTDVIKVYLTNDAPSASADDVLADLAGLGTANGYTSGGTDIQNLYSEAGGVGTMTATDVTWTASGGSIGPFRYVPIYDDTHASDILIGWWDYASAITLLDGESFTVDFGANVFIIQ